MSKFTKGKWTTDDMGEMYELIRELAYLPGEQCMISPMILRARELLARIDVEDHKHG